MLPHNTTFAETAESASYRPRISRETRRLLLTAVVAVLTLWVLARLRFPDRPPVANPVPPILEQLTEPATFADLASRVADLRARLADSLVVVVLIRDDGNAGAAPVPPRLPALRIREDLAVTVIPPGSRGSESAPLGVVAEDRGSGLTVVETATRTRPALPIFWSPRELNQPRYLLASSTSPQDVALRPAFVAALTPIEIPQWPDAVWGLPADTTLTSGSLLFTEDAELVGIVAPYESGLAVVPARMLLAAAERLLEAPQKIPADVGVDVDALTPRLAIAAGTETGVVVTWVDSTGAAAAMLRAGDVIQSVNAVDVATPEQWRVLAARIGVGDMLALRVTRRGAQRDVQIAIPTPPDEDSSALGVAMRSVARVGTEVMRVERGSAAASAGLAAGDLITAVGGITSPTPAQVASTFAAMQRGDVLIVAVRRGGGHRVMAIQR